MGIIQISRSFYRHAGDCVFWNWIQRQSCALLLTNPASFSGDAPHVLDDLPTDLVPGKTLHFHFTLFYNTKQIYLHMTNLFTLFLFTKTGVKSMQTVTYKQGLQFKGPTCPLYVAPNLFTKEGALTLHPWNDEMWTQ